MKTNLCMKVGVAYTAACKKLFSLFLNFLLLSLLLNKGMNAGVIKRNTDTDLQETRFRVFPGGGEKNLKNMFLRTKSHKTLEILPDGTVRGTSCNHDTKYSLLRSQSQSTTKTASLKPGAETVFQTLIYGIEAKKYLCVNPKGKVYAVSASNFSEEDCGFNESVNFFDSPNSTKDNPVLHQYSKYRHHKHGTKPPSGKGIRKYHLALGCDNTAIAISTRKDRRAYINDTLFLVEKTPSTVGELKEQCSEISTKKSTLCSNMRKRRKCSQLVKPRPGEKRNYVKFCRSVMKNFFSATLKQLRLFRKRDCYDVLRRFNRCKKRRKNKKS